MDITDENKNKSGENKPLLLPKPCVTSPSNNTMEHVIPQMIITSADDTSEDNKNGCEISTSEMHSSEISSDVSTQKKIDDAHSSADIGQQPIISTEQSSETRAEDVNNTIPCKEETKSQDYSIHTAVQRPLIIESERSISPSSASDAIGSKDPQVSDSVPTTMQRPLIFDNPHVLPETSIKPIEQEKYEDAHENETSVKELSLGEEPAICQSESFSEYNIESSNFVPQSSISSPFPEKDTFSYRDLDERDDIIRKEGNLIKEPQHTKDFDQSNVKKEGLPNVKKFFDSLLHETHAENNKSSLESCQITDSANTKSTKPEKHSIKNFFSPSKSDSAINEKVNEQKSKKDSHEQAGDSKYNIKKMFDSFKADTSDHKIKAADKNKIDKSQEEKSTDPTKSHHKDSKSGIKKFFDSFKHESANVSSLEEPVKKSDEQDVSIKVPVSFPKKEEIPVISKTVIPQDVNNSNIVRGQEPSNVTEHREENVVEPIKSHKDSKSGIKKFFDSFKHESSNASLTEEPVKSVEQDISIKVPVSFPKKEEIPIFSETVIPQDMSNSNIVKVQDTSSVIEHKEEKTVDSIKSHKDSKSGIKKFFDSFKHEGVNASPAEEPVKKSDEQDISIKVPVSFPKKEFSITPETVISEGVNNSIIVKGHDLPDVIENKEHKKEKQMDTHGIKKFFDSFKHDKPSANDDNKNIHTEVTEKKSTIRKSHSFKESLLGGETSDTRKELGSTKSVKHFFDSFKQDGTDLHSSSKDVKEQKKKELKRSQSCKERIESTEVSHGFKGFLDSFTHKKTSSQSTGKESTDHIYDVVEKTVIPEVNPCDLVSKSISHKKADENSKECKENQKLLDSILSKGAIPKSKTGDCPKKVRMSDDAKISSEINKVTGSTSDYISDERSPIKSSSYEPSSLSESKEKDNVKKQTKVPSIQINGPSSHSDTKLSMLNTFSDNFSAIKDKIFQPKEEKKSKIVVVDKETKCKEYDLEIAAKTEHSDETSGTYRPINDSYLENINSNKEITSDLKNKDIKPSLIIQSSPKSVVPSKTIKKEISSPDTISKQQKSPETLYDTCCFRLAVLFSNKAIEMVSDKGKIPPKKPPKPTAEAIAKARANVVSQRLREMQYKGQSIGENIPVGYDGIRFADDETESSCDYKDVDNFDYIMDYELINRYKFDSKLDTFSDPSTCSGSYYTADTVTLKDETFSDAPLETISLGSNESHLLQNLSMVKGKSEGRVLPATNYSFNLDNKPLFSSRSSDGKKFSHEPSKTSSNDTKKFKSSIPTPNKKIPPPLPPKPIITSKQKNLKNVPSKKNENNAVSECINGLSLSPRLQNKLSKDAAAATQKRPLLVAGLKETEFSSLKTKSKVQSKERKFDMVLKNESLKSIDTISSHKPLTSSKSTPEMSCEQTTFGSLTKKATPQRPPLPLSISHSDDKYPKKLRTAPKVPEKPKRESASSPTVAAKRTISPPRPPPPTSLKSNAPPPRPPPPTGLQTPEKISSQINQHQESTSSNHLNDKPEKQASLNILPTTSLEMPNSTCSSTENVSSDFTSKHSEKYHHPRPEVHEDFVSESKMLDTASFQDIALTEPESKEHISFQTILVSENTREDFEQSPIKEQISMEVAPTPPIRIRRIRSRTVEVTRIEEVPQQNLRRSQSLSDIDIQNRTSLLNTPSEKIDLKHLYTSVHKNGKKSTLNDSQSTSLEKLSGRPLPAPPPPPRKFRSLDRKPKEKGKHEISQSLEYSETSSLDRKLKEKKIFEFSQTLENSETNTIAQFDLELHPPTRKKKVDKHRFHSLGHDHTRNDSETRTSVEDSKISRSSSVPLRPKRRAKQSNVEYDENANVAFPVQAEVHVTDIILDECGNEIKVPNIPSSDATDSVNLGDCTDKIIPNPRRKKEKNPKEKSHSSWYDESQMSCDFEIVDWTPVDEAESKFYVNSKKRPTRRCSDPGKGRRTSKFYVDVQLETGLLPLVDKETSPVPLDCSEKSVQTSLETLSQGMTSRGEASDDTDELLDLAQTLQNELKVIINRHKSTSDVGDDSSAINTPVLSATDSEGKSNFKEPKGSKLKISPSIRSSNSEVWPLTSSEESDSEISPRRPQNLTEIAVKRNERKIFYIAQEIMTSEEMFVDALKLLNEDFKAAVELSNQQKGVAVIPEETLSQILNHLPQLQHLNENLLMELKDRIDNWDKIGKIADIIVKMGPFLKLYSWFIHDFESNLSLLEDSKKRYPLFAQVVKEFEASARCKRLALNHFMLKPIQRIPQYRLLLQEYLHHLPEEHADYKDTVAALQIVSEVATHANDSMKHGDNAQKLISIQNSIMGHKEIIKPGRLFVKEGELMKLSRKGMQPRWFVLFNDLLLYLTPVQQGLFRVNHELPLTGMKVAIPIQQDYQNEFSIISVARSFTLAARSPEERQEWIIALTKAIEENASKRSTFTNIRLQQKPQEKVSEEDEGEFVLGKKAPVWIPDARVTMCQLCTSEFTVTFRRHHCRACGKVVCSICSSNRISLPYLGNRIARVCDDCHSKLGPGSGTCTESAETDSDNQQIAVKPHLRTEHRPVKKGKRNLPSVLKEVCANDQGSTISGYLQKKSGKSWKREWFVVKDKVLYEYKASEDVAALRSLPLLGYKIESFSEAHENIDPSLLFQLTHSGQAPILFHADTVGSTERWISALKEASVLE